MSNQSLADIPCIVFKPEVRYTEKPNKHKQKHVKYSIS